VALLRAYAPVAVVIGRGVNLVSTVHCSYESPCGKMLLVADGKALIGVYFVGQKYAPTTRQLGKRSIRTPILVKARRQLDLYFSGRLGTFALTLMARGTDFQRAVWKALRSIPYGKTITYGELAKRVGQPSARAVGNAVGKNPISIVVPCHRVIGCNGSLTGYAGGLGKKRALLGLESGAAMRLPHGRHE